MNSAVRHIQRIYLTLLLCNTLAASLIWGINTIFLLDAGLSNFEAFAANAFFTVGMVLFEIPTGVIADLKGRRTSFLLGTLTLAVSTLLYFLLWHWGGIPFWAWAGTSILLGLGFTFFSGAVEAWLVDAMTHKGYTGKMDAVFGKGQIVTGIGMLVGSVGGGFIAQATNLGVPYILRAVILAFTFVLAFLIMRDVGFTPSKGESTAKEVKKILKNSIDHGLRNPPVRWIMLSAPLIAGVSFYGFYALQPYLLELWGDEQAYGIAGVAAAILALAQVVGGSVAPYTRRLFNRRTTILLAGIVCGTLLILGIGLFTNFWFVILLVALWGLLSAAITPVRQAYLNGIIPSQQRATLLSFDSLLGSSGGVVVQPVLGRAADVWNYPASYLLGSAINAFAIPIVWLARRAANTTAQAKEADIIEADENPAIQDSKVG
jgi:MFS family permease